VLLGTEVGRFQEYGNRSPCPLVRTDRTQPSPALHCAAGGWPRGHGNAGNLAGQAGPHHIGGAGWRQDGALHPSAHRAATEVPSEAAERPLHLQAEAALPTAPK